MEIITIFGIIAAIIVAGFVMVFLSLGFSFYDKTDLYKDSKGNIHLNCSGDFWDGSFKPKYPSKIDWTDVQGS
jgi:hypothetical protein